MAAERKTPKPKTPKGISAYPPEPLRELLTRIKAEMGHSEGQIMVLALEAFSLLIEGEMRVHPFVTQLRTLREHKATFLDMPKPWPGNNGKTYRPNRKSKR